MLNSRVETKVRKSDVLAAMGTPTIVREIQGFESSLIRLECQFQMDTPRLCPRLDP